MVKLITEFFQLLNIRLWMVNMNASNYLQASDIQAIVLNAQGGDLGCSVCCPLLPD